MEEDEVAMKLFILRSQLIELEDLSGAYRPGGRLMFYNIQYAIHRLIGEIDKLRGSMEFSEEEEE